jgi:hypothetical protein
MRREALWNLRAARPTDPVIILPFPADPARGETMESRGPSGERGITLAGILVIVAALILLAAVLVPLSVRARRHTRITECMDRLRGLHRAQADPRAQGLPLRIGSTHWTRLADLQPPLLDAAALRCPLAQPREESRTDYLGPVRDPGPLGADTPIGCDDQENHGEHGSKGGNVLQKSGAVKNDAGAFWQGAFQNYCSR